MHCHEQMGEVERDSDNFTEALNEKETINQAWNTETVIQNNSSLWFRALWIFKATEYTYALEIQ